LVHRTTSTVVDAEPVGGAAPGRLMLLTSEPELHRAEPKTPRYRLLHVAARITRGQRKVFLRLAEHWPWALALAKAFTRLRLIPLPA